MKRAFSIFMLLSCCGCGYIRKQNALESWVGKDQQTLVESWGDPQEIRTGIKDPSETLFVYPQCYTETNGAANAARSLSNSLYGVSTNNQVATELHAMNNPSIPAYTACDYWEFVLRGGIVVRDRVGNMKSGEEKAQAFRQLRRE